MSTAVLSVATVTIDGTGIIDVSGRGYAGGGLNQDGYGPGKGRRGTSRTGGGAGYGGAGGQGSVTGP